MAKQQTIIHTDAKEWKITEVNSKGVETIKDTIPDVQPMGELEAIGVFQSLVSKETDARRGALSLLCHIWLHAERDPNVKLNLTKYVGKGDKKTGQLGTGIKDDFRAAEDAYFRQYADENHPDHEAYMAHLPKLNERSEVLAEEDRHSYFVTRTRKSPSYANAKNLFLTYLAFVGHEPFTVDEVTDELVGIEPPEVMRARVSEAKSDVQPQDNSWEKRMQDLIRQLINPDNPEKPLVIDGKRIPGLLQDIKILTAELQRRLKHYEKTEADLAAIHQKYHGGVPAEGQTMIEKAQNSAKIDGKPLPEVQEEHAQDAPM